MNASCVGFCPRSITCRSTRSGGGPLQLLDNVHLVHWSTAPDLCQAKIDDSPTMTHQLCQLWVAALRGEGPSLESRMDASPPSVADGCAPTTDVSIEIAALRAELYDLAAHASGNTVVGLPHESTTPSLASIPIMSPAQPSESTVEFNFSADHVAPALPEVMDAVIEWNLGGRGTQPSYSGDVATTELRSRLSAFFEIEVIALIGLRGGGQPSVWVTRSSESSLALGFHIFVAMGDMVAASSTVCASCSTDILLEREKNLTSVFV